MKHTPAMSPPTLRIIRRWLWGGALGAVWVALGACGSGAHLPPAPALPIDALATFSDDWVEAAAPLPGPVWSVHLPLSTVGDFDDQWTLPRMTSRRPAIAAVADGLDTTALVFGQPDRRAVHLSSVRRAFDAPSAKRVVASVRVWEGGLAGLSLTGPPLVRLQAVSVDEKTGAEVVLGQTSEVARWRTPDSPAEWETLSLSLDLPRQADRIVVELSPGTGRATGQVAFSELVVEAPHAAANILARAPVSRVFRKTPHPRVRSIRSRHDQRPAIVSPTPGSWLLPLPDRTEAATLRTFVAVPSAGLRGAKKSCWTIEPIPADSGPSASGCDQPNSDWQPVTLDLPAEVQALRFSAAPEREGRPMAPVAWARPLVAAATVEDDRPDIVLVVVDTLRADGLGISGAPHPASPHLDALAQTMDRYTKAFAASSWTLPSLASVLSGRWPSAHGAGFRNRLLAVAAKRSSNEFKSRTFAPISPDIPLLAEQLAAAGYCTEAYVTNYFFGASFGFQRGFERFTQYNGNSIEGAENLVSLLEGRDPCTGPRFTVLHLFEPHMPLRYRSDAPAGWSPEVPDRELSLEEAEDGRTALVLRKVGPFRDGRVDVLRGFYDTETHHADRILGQLLPELAPPGTGLVFLSDHGEHFGEHGRWNHGTSMYDELIRVPLWVRAPDRTGPGAVHSAPVSLVDVAPTVLGWAGVEAPALDGIPLGTDATDRVLLAEHMHRGPDTLAVISQDVLAVRTLGRGARDAHAVGRTPLWTATDERFALTDQGATALDAAVPATLQRFADDHFQSTYPGIHVICARADAAHEVIWHTTVGTIVQVTPLKTTEGDAVQVAPGGRRLNVTVQAGTEPLHMVAETLPHGPLVVPDTCTAERRGLAAGHTTLDAETVQALEAIGYLGD